LGYKSKYTVFGCEKSNSQETKGNQRTTTGSVEKICNSAYQQENKKKIVASMKDLYIHRPQTDIKK
jgi:hypothetical protein